MLKIARCLRELDFGALAAMCTVDLDAEQALYAYLRQEFFSRPQDAYCLWVEDGKIISCLRLQSYRDGLLLEALETNPAHRGRGYGKKLVSAVLAETKMTKGYVHIHKKNAASIAVHEKCGFRRILDYAVFADGSVGAQYDTYLYEQADCR